MAATHGAPAVITHNSGTVDGSIVYISGWNLVTGGVSKYVWSADGGKTWHDAFKYNDKAWETSSDAIKTTAVSRSGDSTIALYADNTCFQGTNRGVAADLSAYAGKTVNVTIAAVPNLNTETLCLVAHITGVTVPSAE